MLKLASYHRCLGDSVELVRGCVHPEQKPDRVYVTSLYTWAWKPVWQAVRFYKTLFPTAEVWLGWLYASLMSKHAAESGADYAHTGIFEEALGELEAYAKLIKEVKAFLDEYAIDAEISILRELREQVDSDPRYVAREARIYRKLLRRGVGDAREKVLQKRREKWLKQKETMAVVAVMARAFELRKILDEISWQFHKLRMKSITNPEVERIICHGLKVKNLEKAEENAKKFYIEAFKETLRQELKDNPYSWYAEPLTA